MRPTVLIGDSSSGSSRLLRRQTYFAEPNSGRVTLRAHTYHTGHVGGRCGRVEGSGLGPPDVRLNGGVVRPREPRGVREEVFFEPTPERVGGGGGRGSNSAVRAHFGFTHSLRPGSDYEAAEQAIGGAEWRAASGFGPDDMTLMRPHSSFDRTPQAVAFDSEEDRRRVGFKDRGLRRFGFSGALEPPGAGAVSAMRPSFTAARDTAAGGPGGPKALVSWRNWQRRQRDRASTDSPTSRPETRPAAATVERGASHSPARHTERITTHQATPLPQPGPNVHRVQFTASNELRSSAAPTPRSSLLSPCPVSAAARVPFVEANATKITVETRDQRLDRRRQERPPRSAAQLGISRSSVATTSTTTITKPL